MMDIDKAVIEYREKHPKCFFCKHFMESEFYDGVIQECTAKRKWIDFPDMPRPFCKLYKVKGVEE